MYFTIKCIKNTTNKAYRPNAHLSDIPNAPYRILHYYYYSN